ncbi:plasma-membrane choline transporter-domain-containing protein [Mycotypha africana]|uniref:plasma-membrane choline transporter-domain-containing protein n=1 Tax=Mycotypha africana TaxID=64632 RepID=UPI0023018939|nr:plasma-membrane choline transporter-domain-containing protein [Mycotypha africana]KAI8987689.1 plasma-membrane choline transporter-domain-containing protein [Mycotypha africana]
MERSLPNFARETISTLKNSFLFQGRGGYYAQMDQESDNEEDDDNNNNTISHSLFYSVRQNDTDINEDSIPLTLSNAYSDRSQLLFDQEQEEEAKPSSIYLDEPLSAEPSQGIIYPNPLSESLLPTSASSHAIEKYLKGTTFETIKGSAGKIHMLVPVALVSVFIWSLVESLQKNYVVEDGKRLSATDKGLTLMSFIPFMLNLIYLKVVFDNKSRINRTITVIELACDVVRFNPGLFLVLVLLLGVFIGFSIIWLVLFNRLWLIGHLSDKSSATGATWIVNNYVYSIAAFYVFIFMWTAKLLVYMERFAVSAIAAQWYFHRNEPSSDSDVNPPWKAAIVRASTTSFGTLALGSLILAIIQFLQFTVRLLKKYSKTARPFSAIAAVILRFIQVLVSTFSNYTITLAGITGDGFFSAASTATKIFRRNLLTGLFGDLLTQVILYIGTGVVAVSSGLGAYIYATHNLHSPHGFVVGLVGTLLPWYLSQFFSYLLMSM